MSLLSSFESSRLIPISVPDLTPVVRDVDDYFRMQGYEVSVLQTATGAWQISIVKGEWWRTILGTKTALNIRIEMTAGGTLATAGVGLFELQALPTILTLFVFTPIILGQIWGIVQQEKLDDEAIMRVEQALNRYAGMTAPASPFTPPPLPTDSTGEGI